MIATGDSIEFWDASNLVLRARMLTPEPLLTMDDTDSLVRPMIALDSTGSNIYALSKSGITVFNLGVTIDSLPRHDWALSRTRPK